MPDNSALKQFIRQTIPLDEAMAADIASNYRHVTIAKGELFLEEGKVNDNYLFLEKGFMRSFLFDTEGEEITLNLFAPGQVVFEVASLFRRIPSEENIEALTDCSGWMLTYEELNKLFHTIPAFRDFGRAVLVKGFISFKMRTLSMINRSAEQRYGMLMASSPEILQHVPLKHIASFLGITDSSLSRIRKEISKK